MYLGLYDIIQNRSGGIIISIWRDFFDQMQRIFLFFQSDGYLFDLTGIRSDGRYHNSQLDKDIRIFADIISNIWRHQNVDIQLSEQSRSTSNGRRS